MDGSPYAQRMTMQIARGVFIALAAVFALWLIVEMNSVDEDCVRERAAAGLSTEDC